MTPEPARADELRLDRRQLLVLARLGVAPDGDADSVRDPTGADAPVPPPTRAEIDALSAAGLLAAGRPHPDVAHLAAAVAQPVVRLRIERVAPPPTVRCPGWVGPHAAVLALPQPEGPDQILAVPVPELILHLAALIGLSPRPPAAFPTPEPGETRLAFRITASWYGPGGTPAERVVAGVDAGERGWWGGEPDGSGLTPLTSTTLFRRLTGLLPTDAELG